MATPKPKKPSPSLKPKGLGVPMACAPCAPSTDYPQPAMDSPEEQLRRQRERRDYREGALVDASYVFAALAEGNPGTMLPAQGVAEMLRRLARQ